jgi:ABC-type antimicrobial peptide transport system permease subunit
MFVAFGALALVLAAVGLYSVIAYNVTQRQHELGVRMALGAQGPDVIRLVVTDGLKVVGVGVTGGLLVALWAGKFVQPLLFSVSPRDPSVFVLVATTLIRVALGAGRGEVMRMVIGEGVALAAAGGVLGLAGALALTRLLRAMLYEISPSDPATYAAIVVVAGIAVVAASWLPARRASRVDPNVVLRSD